MSKAVVKFKETALAQRDELAVNDVISQVQKIAQIKNSVMVKDEHYGTIPGTQKATLYKSGAEKLAMTFRFAPRFLVTTTQLNNGDHREYSCVCTLSHITSGNFLAEGVGSCSTMESKYRWRKADPEVVGPVPQNYWKEKDAAKKADLIGGKGFGVKKIGAKWNVIKFSNDRVEHDNPADFYNTCLKMAKKRAFVDAVITATGGSDLFTQDIEDDVHENNHHIDTAFTEIPDEPDEKKSSIVNDRPQHGASFQTKQVRRVDDMPEEPREAGEKNEPETPGQQAPASPAPADEINETRVSMTEWREKARELGKVDKFDAACKQELADRRVKKIDDLAKPAQAAVLGKMRMLVESWIPSEKV
ncbi:MAG: hypothetical protein IT440_15680 [Phycisphaeraceae bacterium]|nr:hypothetical protein [Phycisphaeraceae bacterium]